MYTKKLYRLEDKLKFLYILLIAAILTGCSKQPDILDDEIKIPPILVEANDTAPANAIITPSITAEAKKELDIHNNELLENLNEICQSPRVYDTEGEQRGVDYLVQKMNEYGYHTSTQEFGVYRKSPGDTDPLKYSIEENRVGTGINIIGSSKIQNRKETLYITAHHDTTSDTNGIRDNGSGVTTVLEIARQLNEIELPVNVVFVFFGAEEVGFQGSCYFVSQLTEEEIKHAVGCINLDCVGGRGDKEFVFNTYREEINVLYLLMNEKESFPLRNDGRSDHTPFQLKGIPSIFISDYTIQIKDTIDNPSEELDIERLKELTEFICNKIIAFDLTEYHKIIKNSYIKEYAPVAINPFLNKLFPEINDFAISTDYLLVQMNKVLTKNGSRSDIQYIFKNSMDSQVTITEYNINYLKEYMLDEINDLKTFSNYAAYDVIKDDNHITVRYKEKESDRYLILEGHLSEEDALELLHDEPYFTYYGFLGTMLEHFEP